MTLSKGICQQEDSMAAQLRGDHIKLARLLDVTSDERGADAGEWEIQYMGNGLPLFKHTKSGFRTFDKPRALRVEEAMILLREAAAARPTSSILSMPTESNWIEHCLQPEPESDKFKSNSLLFYQNATTGQVTWEDPYETTLQAASNAADRNRYMIKNEITDEMKHLKSQLSVQKENGDQTMKEVEENVLQLMEDAWDQHFTKGAGQMVFWQNRNTGECTWVEPGKGHIRSAIREAHRSEEKLLAENEGDNATEEAALLTTGTPNANNSNKRFSIFSRLDTRTKQKVNRRTSLWQTTMHFFAGFSASDIGGAINEENFGQEISSNSFQHKNDDHC